MILSPCFDIYFDRGVAFLQVLRDPFEWPANGRQDSWSTNTAEAVWDAEFMRFHLHKELEHRDCKSLLDGVAAGVSVYKTLKPRSFLGDQEPFLMRYDAVKVWILWSIKWNQSLRTYNKGAGTDSTPICLTSFHPLLGPYLIHLCSAYSIYFILFLGRVVPTHVHPFIISQTDCH